MSEETKAEQNLVERSDVPKKFSGKKWGIIGAIAVVLIALVAGIGIYNSPNNRLSRQLDLGNRYLEEQNYEQAIVEFDKAIEIDPMCVDAYLGKAEAYIGLGDLQSALDTLQAGYELTHDERLKSKSDEIETEIAQQKRAEEEAQRAAEGTDSLADAGMLSRSDSEDEEGAEAGEEEEEKEDDEQLPEGDYLELPFSLSDITIMGYDLFEPHLYEVADALGCPMNGRIDLSDDGYEIISAQEGGLAWDWDDSSEMVGEVFYDCSGDSDGYYRYIVYQNGVIQLLMTYDNSAFMESSCNVPVYLNTSYNEMCRKLGIDVIKSKAEGQLQELSIGYSSYPGVVYGDGSLYMKDDTGLYRVYYFERTHDIDSWIMKCGLYLENCSGGASVYIEAIFAAEYEFFMAIRDNRENREGFDYALEYVKGGGGYGVSSIDYEVGAYPVELAEYVGMD